jgi:ABC-type branched-subunit amino acid transport system substrate-binding protein
MCSKKPYTTNAIMPLFMSSRSIDIYVYFDTLLLVCKALRALVDKKNYMNKWIIGAVVLIVVAAGVWAAQKPASFGRHYQSGSHGAPHRAAFAEYGEAFKNGIVLAQEKSGSKNVQYIFEDGAYDPGKTVSAFYKLRDTDKVNVLINWGDPTSQALAPVVKGSGIPFVAVTTQPSVTQGNPDVVRTLDTADDFARVLWSYFRTKGIKNIAIVKLEHPYLNNLLRALDEQKQGDEKITVIDTYQSFGDHDFRTSIVKIKNAATKYDTVGVFLGSGQIGQFYNQAGQQGLKIPTFGTDFFESQSDIDAAGKNIDGAVYANFDVSASFRSDYLTKFGNVSQIGYAGNGYDIATLLNSKVDFSSKETILSSFKVQSYSGVLGTYHYVEQASDRYLKSPVHMKVIEGGVIKTIN